MSGWVMTIEFTNDAPDNEVDALMEAIAALCVDHEPRTGWDAIVSAQKEPGELNR